MGPLTQTVKSIVSETHIYSKQGPLTQTVNNGTSYTNCKVYCF